MRKALVLLLLAAAAAGAQELPVTGSHIAGAPSLVPLRVIDRAQIEASGYATFGDFLQRLPEQGGAPGPNVNNGGDGGTLLALHNLGTQRTLVLVDGKRWVPASTGNEIDLNTIPTRLIERIEILEAGGAAVYGDGGVGGVVNVITRKRVSETEAFAFGGLSTRGDAGEWDLGLTSGLSGEKASVFAGVGYFDRRPLVSHERGFAQSRAYDFARGAASFGGSPVLPSGTVSLNPALCTTQACRDLAQAFGATSRTFVAAGSCPTCVDGFRPATASDLYDFQSVNFLVAPLQQLSAFANADYRFLPIARAYFQGSYVNRRSSTQLAPDPITATLDAQNVFNPFGETLTVSRRAVEAPPRSLAPDLDTYRFVAGVDGGLPTGLSYDLSFNFGRTSGHVDTGGSLFFGLNGATGPTFTDSTGTHCGTGDFVIRGCAPVNLLTPAGSLGTAELAQLGLHRSAISTTAQLISARLDATQSLFRLGPTREATAAAGYELRRSSASLEPPSLGVFAVPLDLPVTDDTFNFARIDGSYDTHEAYLEIDVPALETLDLRAAVRGIHAEDLGFAGTWLAGGRWEALPGLAVRGSYSTGLREPNVAERASFLALSPERSRHGTAGLAYDPEAIKGLGLSLDYWNIAVSRALVLPGCQGEFPTCQQLAQGIVNGGGVITSGLGLGGRYSLASPWGAFAVRTVVSYLLRYDLTFAGGQTLQAAGNYDLGSNSGFGGLTPRVKAEAAVDWRLAGLAATLGGRFIGGFDECANASGTNLLGRCSLGGAALPAHSVPAWVSFDLNASYALGGTTLAAGVRNLFDAAPPVVYDSFLTFADPAYDFVGRSVQARVSQKF